RGAGPAEQLDGPRTHGGGERRFGFPRLLAGTTLRTILLQVTYRQAVAHPAGARAHRGTVPAARDLRDFRVPLAARVARRGPTVRRHRRTVRPARPNPARPCLGPLVRPADGARGNPG